MGAWLSNISLKYKFWAVNAVAFITTLLLVLYAVQLEQQARGAGLPFWDISCIKRIRSWLRLHLGSLLSN